MNTDDSQGAAMGNSNNRSIGLPKYPEKGPNYSPSTSYNYGHQKNGYSSVGQQSTRRSPERFKREPSSLNDRLVKQNDIIIRLLKEIRDRLPNATATTEQATPDENNGDAKTNDKSDE